MKLRPWLTDYTLLLRLQSSCSGSREAPTQPRLTFRFAKRSPVLRGHSPTASSISIYRKRALPVTARALLVAAHERRLLVAPGGISSPPSSRCTAPVSGLWSDRPSVLSSSASVHGHTGGWIPPSRRRYRASEMGYAGLTRRTPQIFCLEKTRQPAPPRLCFGKVLCLFLIVR